MGSAEDSAADATAAGDLEGDLKIALSLDEVPGQSFNR